MAQSRTSTTQDPDFQQITTEDVRADAAGAPAARTAPLPASDPEPVPTREDRDPGLEAEEGESPVPSQPGIGIEGEFAVWEARYSIKNFAGRLVLRILATIALGALAVFAYGRGEDVSRSLNIITIVAGIAVLLYWIWLGWQVFHARMSHFYRLTNKRLFVWTGVFSRRLDQVELVKVDDVYLKQPTVFHRWFSVGTVVVESSEEKYPITYLTGIDQPEEVMDTVWHTARAEREGHTIRVDEV